MLEAEKVNDRQDALGRMYSTAIAEMQEFRTTMAKLLTAFLTILLLFLGWAVTNTAKLDPSRQLAIIAGILLVTGLGLLITRTFERYFLDIAGVISRIDRVHGAFEKGRYLEGEALYPERWRRFGDTTWKEPVFRLAYVALLTMGGFASLVVEMAL